jgi:hypothetical protein
VYVPLHLHHQLPLDYDILLGVENTTTSRSKSTGLHVHSALHLADIADTDEKGRWEGDGRWAGTSALLSPQVLYAAASCFWLVHAPLSR